MEWANVFVFVILAVLGVGLLFASFCLVVVLALKHAMQAEFTELETLHKAAQEQLREAQVDFVQPVRTDLPSRRPVGAPGAFSDPAPAPAAALERGVFRRKAGSCFFCARIRQFFNSRRGASH